MSGSSGMNGEISSCNVAGFTKNKIRHFKNVLKTSNIACLQETHGRSSDSTRRIRALGFDEGVFSLFTNAARGSAILWKRPYKKVGMEWVDKNGRLAAVVLKNELELKILVVSVYAPNVNSSRDSQSTYISFLITLEHVLSEMIAREKPDRLIMLGDFNVICNAELDSKSANPTTFPVVLEALFEVVQKFDTYDAYRSLFPTKVAFTFSRQGMLAPNGSRSPPVMNRLDYAFLDSTTLQEVNICEHLDPGLTDHRLIKLGLGGEKKKKLLGLWKHNDTLNRDSNFVALMKENLIGYIPQASVECRNRRGAWEAIKGKAREWSRKYSIEKMRKEREEKKLLEEKIASGANATDIAGKNQYLEDKRKLDEIHGREIQRVIFRAKVRSLQKDEKFSKFFHMQIKQNRNMSNIDHLVVDERSMDCPKEINKALRDYYANLYASVNPPPPDHNWFQDLKKLPENANVSLEGPLTMNEISNALFKHSKTGKSPGNDGLTVEFYRTFWKELREPLLAALREAIIEGELSPSQKQSVIRLIPKKGRDLSKIKNWRPISLLNVDAKLFSKALTVRMEKYTLQLTSKEQSAFVKGKLLQDNTNTIKQAISYAEKKKTYGIYFFD